MRSSKAKTKAWYSEGINVINKTLKPITEETHETVDFSVKEALVEKVEAIYARLKEEAGPRHSQLFQVDETIDKMLSDAQEGGLPESLKHANQQHKIIVS